MGKRGRPGQAGATLSPTVPVPVLLAVTWLLTFFSLLIHILPGAEPSLNNLGGGNIWRPVVNAAADGELTCFSFRRLLFLLLFYGREERRIHAIIPWRLPDVGAACQPAKAYVCLALLWLHAYCGCNHLYLTLGIVLLITVVASVEFAAW
jgi:hypothetical protein